MIGLEGVILIFVLVFAILNPIKNVVVENSGLKNEEQNNAVVSTENEQESETEEEPNIQQLVYSDAVREKVLSMTVEQKVAQMFVTTPEQLTNMRQVTVTGNTTKNAISAIPVGGLIYSNINFEGSIQTASMTEALQAYYQEQFGFPLFMMIAESGGAEGSPLATANGFAVEKSPEEIGAENSAEAATATATNIAAYMSNQGLNTNIGLNGNYSSDMTISSAMLDVTITAYKEAGIFTAATVYHEQADMIVLNASEPFSDAVNTLRLDMGYQGVLLADTITDANTATDAILAGVDMVYCPNDFKTIYQSVLDGVANGSINEEVINEAVMRILTYKDYE